MPSGIDARRAIGSPPWDCDRSLAFIAMIGVDESGIQLQLDFNSDWK